MKFCYKLFRRCSMHVSICLVVFSLAVGATRAQAECPYVVPSGDGTPISYEVYGTGAPALVFVHGWSCDSRYWRAQVPYFSKDYRVIVLDLAGHGHSGSERSRYTMKAFGDDVRAVTEATGSQNVILIGHSMGGSVIAEAARLMPTRVIGLIGIDTLENIEYPMTVKERDQMIAPLQKDFKKGCREFIEGMISDQTDERLREWILADMAAAPPAVALSALEEMVSQYITGEAARIFDEIPIPVIDVNGDMWPVNYEANRRHMFSFDAIVIKNADHFLMMNRPEEFNRALEQAIHTIVKKSEISIEEVNMAPRISWLGHASFKIEGDGKVIYIDPWQLEDGPKADLILITHDHHDHCSPDDVLKIQKSDTVIVTVPTAAKKLSGNITKVAPGDKITAQGIEILAVPAYNTNKFRSPGIPFHPRESNYVGYVLTVGGTRIYHAGDTDVIPEMESIETDIALLPVSGIYVMTSDEAAEAANMIKPKKVIPMHVGRGIGDLKDRDDFKKKVTMEVEIP